MTNRTGYRKTKYNEIEYINKMERTLTRASRKSFLGALTWCCNDLKLLLQLEPFLKLKMAFGDLSAIHVICTLHTSLLWCITGFTLTHSWHQKPMSHRHFSSQKQDGGGARIFYGSYTWWYQRYVHAIWLYCTGNIKCCRVWKRWPCSNTGRKSYRGAMPCQGLTLTN